MTLDRRCNCKRCRWAPSPEHIGDAHGVAVVLHLDPDSAWALVGWTPSNDASHGELVDAVTRWEAARDAD